MLATLKVCLALFQVASVVSLEQTGPLPWRKRHSEAWRRANTAAGKRARARAAAKEKKRVLDFKAEAAAGGVSPHCLRVWQRGKGLNAMFMDILDKAFESAEDDNLDVACSALSEWSHEFGETITLRSNMNKAGAALSLAGGAALAGAEHIHHGVHAIAHAAQHDAFHAAIHAGATHAQATDAGLQAFSNVVTQPLPVGATVGHLAVQGMETGLTAYEMKLHYEEHHRKQTENVEQALHEIIEFHRQETNEGRLANARLGVGVFGGVIFVAGVITAIVTWGAAAPPLVASALAYGGGTAATLGFAGAVANETIYTMDHRQQLELLMCYMEKLCKTAILDDVANGRAEAEEAGININGIHTLSSNVAETNMHMVVIQTDASHGRGVIAWYPVPQAVVPPTHESRPYPTNVVAGGVAYPAWNVYTRTNTVTPDAWGRLPGSVVWEFPRADLQSGAQGNIQFDLSGRHLYETYYNRVIAYTQISVPCCTGIRVSNGTHFPFGPGYMIGVTHPVNGRKYNAIVPQTVREGESFLVNLPNDG